MSEAEPVRRLIRGDEVLAEFVVTGSDFPWLNAVVRPCGGFSEVRPLFDDALTTRSWLDPGPSS
jgi:hypothetical protein